MADEGEAAWCPVQGGDKLRVGVYVPIDIRYFRIQFKNWSFFCSARYKTKNKNVVRY